MSASGPCRPNRVAALRPPGGLQLHTQMFAQAPRTYDTHKVAKNDHAHSVQYHVSNLHVLCFIPVSLKLHYNSLPFALCVAFLDDADAVRHVEGVVVLGQAFHEIRQSNHRGF